MCSTVFGKRRRCKNTCVRKISKQKHLWKVITVKRKRFRQVKIINPFPLNKMIATSITKQPRKARFTTNYRTAEKGMFHINYKIAVEGPIYN